MDWGTLGKEGVLGGEGVFRGVGVLKKVGDRRGEGWSGNSSVSAVWITACCSGV